MRRRINALYTIFIIFILILTFLYSLYQQDIDSLASFQYNSNENTQHMEISEIHFNIPESMYEKQEAIFSSFIKLIKEYEINCYTSRTNMITFSTTHYWYSNDSTFLQNIPVTIGPLKETTDFDEYTTLTADKSKQLRFFFQAKDIYIKPLQELDANEIHYESATFLVTSTNQLEHKLQTITDCLEQQFPTVSVEKVNVFQSHVHADNSYIYQGIVLYSCSVFTILLLLIISILQFQKNIAIMKSDGYTNLLIFTEIFVKPILLRSTIGIIVSVLFLFPFFNQNLFLFHNIITHYMANFSICLLILFICGLLLIYLLANISLIKSIKGHNNIHEVLSTLHLVKYALLILGLSLLNQGVISTQYLINQELHNQNRSTNLNHWYNMGYFSFYADTSLIFGENRSNLVDTIEEKLLTDYQAFLFFDVYLSLDDGTEINNLYSTDTRYCQMHSLPQATSYPAIYLNSERTFPDTYLQDIIGILVKHKIIDTPNIEFIEYNYSIPNFSKKYYSSNENLDNAILLVNEDTFDIANYFFYSETTTEETRQEISELFTSNQIPMIFTIDNQKENYEKSRLLEWKLHLPNCIYALSFLVLILLIDIKIFDLDYQENKKENFVLHLEGVPIAQILFKSIMIDSLLFMLLLLYMFYLQLQILSILLLVFYFIIKTAIIIYLRKYTIYKDNVRNCL